MEALAAQARAQDRLRYASALYAPGDKRAALFALAAFSGELARLPAKVTTPELGEIRLQFWHDALDGKDGAELPAMMEVRARISRGLWPLSAFQNMIEARRAELYADRFASVNDLEGHFGETRGALFQLAAMALGGGAELGVLSGHAACVEGAADAVSNPRSAAILPQALARGPEAIADFGLGHAAACAPLLGALPAQLRPAFLPLAVLQKRLVRLAGGLAAPSPLSVQFQLMKTASRGWPKR